MLNPNSTLYFQNINGLSPVCYYFKTSPPNLGKQKEKRHSAINKLKKCLKLHGVKFTYQSRESVQRHGIKRLLLGWPPAASRPLQQLQHLHNYKKQSTGEMGDNYV